MKRTRMALTTLLSLLLLIALAVFASAQGAAVAQIGNTDYASLSEAVAAVPANGVETTITLKEDLVQSAPVTVAEGQNIVLDMAGHDITVTSDFTDRIFTNNGTLTIQGNGTVDVSAAGANGYGTVNNFGTLTVVDGTYTGSDASEASCFYNREGGTATFINPTIDQAAGCVATEANTDTYIYGGTYVDKYYPAIENRGNMLITAGSFTNTSCSSCDGSRWGYTIRSGQASSTAYLRIQGAAEDSVQVTGVQGGLAVIGGTADIYNGVYQTVRCVNNKQHSSSYYAGYFTGESYETAVNVYGGSFTSYNKTALQVGNGNPAPDSGAGKESTVMIYGGTFTGGDKAKTAITVEDQDNAIGGASILGGSFSSNVSTYVPAYCEGEMDEDGVFQVTQKTEGEARIGDRYYDTLAAALADAADGETVTLLNNVENMSQIIINDGRKLTLDLNGFNVGFGLKQNFSIRCGGLELTGSGKLYEEQPYYAPVMLYGTDDPKASGYTTLTVGKDVTLEGWAGAFIDCYSNRTAAYGIEVTVYGTLHSVRDITEAGGHALYVNGNIKATEGNVPKIRLDGATLQTDYGNGMYLAGFADTTIVNSKIDSTGENGTGIEIRAGKLTIEGDTLVEAGDEKFDITPNGNGSTTANVALAVVQHTTKLPTEVTVLGGTFRGTAAFFEQNAQNNDEDAIAKIRLDVQGGNFEGIFYSENKENFVSGGFYSAPVKRDYLLDTLTYELNNHGTYSYYPTFAQAQANAQSGAVITNLQGAPGQDSLTVKFVFGLGKADFTMEIPADTAIYLLERPSVSGYTFLGWKSSADGKVYDAGEKVEITKDTTFTALWRNNLGIVVDIIGGAVEGKEFFTDVSMGDWYYEAVKFCFDYDLMNGVGNGKFSPDTTLTRAMLAQVLYNLDEARGSYAGVFTDVTGSAWYANAVNWAAASGIVEGKGNNKFDPDAPVTRQEMAAIFYRYASYKGYDVSAAASLDRFTDASKVASWAKDAMSWAVGGYVINGKGAGRLDPTGTATRAEVAQILMNFCNNVL